MNIFGFGAILIFVTANSLTLALWISNLEKALNYGRENRMVIILYFYSESCPHCYHVETFILGDKDVENYIKDKFILVPIDYDENNELSEKFYVYGTPTFIFFNPINKNVIGSFFGGKEKEEFMRILKDVCNKSKLLRRC